MYKDLYKKANDSIPTDDVKMRVMKRIEKPARSRNVRRFAEISALAACLAVTVSVVGIYNNFEKEQNNNVLKIAGSMPAASVEKTETEVEEKLNVQVQESSPVPQKEVAKKSEPKPTVTATPKESAKSALPERLAEETSPIVETEIKGAKEEETPSTSLVINKAKDMSEDGVSPAAFMVDRSVGRIEEVTRDEYYQYIGKNIEADAVLPEGFELFTEETAMFEVADDGSYKNDIWCFVYQNEEKSVEIVTSKKAEDVKEILADDTYEKSLILNKEAVVIKENDICKAYIMPEDVGYSLTCFGISETEIENLLVSLAK